MHPAFDKPMVLFDHIIEVFALSQCTGCWKRALLLKPVGGPGVGRMFLHGKHAGERRVTRPEGLAEQSLGSLGIPRCTPQEMHGAALGVDRPIEIVPFFSTFHRFYWWNVSLVIA